MEKAVSATLDVLSAVFLLVFFILTLRKNKKDRALFACVCGISMAVFAMLAADLIYVGFSLRAETEAILLAFMAKEIQLVFNCLAIFLWADYVSGLLWTKARHRNLCRLVFRCIYTVNLLLILANLLTHTLFYIDEGGRYVVCYAGMLALTGLNYGSGITAFVMLLRHRHRIHKESFMPLVLSPVPVLLCELLSFPMRGVSLICGYAISVILLLSVYESYASYREIDRLIDRALENNKFLVYYQPIYSCRQKDFLGCEALLRLQNDDRSFVSPELIIPAAEESGRIHDIGRYVLDTVCDFIRSDTFRELGLDFVNVNFSMRQISRPGLADGVLNFIEERGVRPEQLCVEITESAMIGNPEVVAENVEKLSTAGIRFALDDYGSGYSNLYRIVALPFAQIKLDRTLVQSCNDERTATVMESTMVMLRRLKLDAVAEGVETAEQLRRFQALGVSHVQGFYFSRPLPPMEFAEFIRAFRREQPPKTTTLP